MFDHRCDGNGTAGLDVGRNISELRERLLRHLLYEDIENPTARQADSKGIVVADAVALQHGVAVIDHLLRKRINRRLHAASRYRSHRRVIGPNQHGRTGLPGRRTPRADDGAHTDGLA
jgi:hypothetical protein